MKTILLSLAVAAWLAVPAWSAPVPYAESFEAYAAGDTAVVNFTELSTSAWTIVGGSYSGQAYQNGMSVVSAGIGIAAGQNALANIEFPDLAASSFVLSTTFRIDTLTLTGADPANTASIGLGARAADATGTGSDRYQVTYFLDTDALGNPTGSLRLDEHNLFFPADITATSAGTLPVVLGEIYTLTFKGTASGPSLALDATLTKSGGGSISVSGTDSANLLSGTYFGYRNFIHVEDGGTTALNADFDDFTAAVPEPTTLSLALLTLPLLWRRYRQ